jgi:dynein heavy chain
LKVWISKGTPSCFWISGFFFPQAFITGTLQNYARKKKVAVDLIQFEFVVCDDLRPEDIKEKPEFGCFIHGMYLEGARWDGTQHQLGESHPKELFSNLPMIRLNPVENRQIPLTGIYNCPLYKVVSRRGTLSTTGHSTNFVMFIGMDFI